MTDTTMTDEWWQELIAARKALEAAMENYHTQVDLHRSGMGSELELTRAYAQKQQAHETEKEIFHQVYQIALT